MGKNSPSERIGNYKAWLYAKVVKKVRVWWNLCPLKSCFLCLCVSCFFLNPPTVYSQGAEVTRLQSTVSSWGAEVQGEDVQSFVSPFITAGCYSLLKDHLHCFWDVLSTTESHPEALRYSTSWLFGYHKNILVSSRSSTLLSLKAWIY